MDDHYATLGVASNAPDDVIRAAYLALAKRYHPDRSPLDEDQMKRLNEAWEVLRDPVKRAIHDADLISTRTGHTGGPDDLQEPSLGNRGWGTGDDTVDETGEVDDAGGSTLGADGWGEEVVEDNPFPAEPSDREAPYGTPPTSSSPSWPSSPPQHPPPQYQPSYWYQYQYQAPVSYGPPAGPPWSRNPTAVTGRRCGAFAADMVFTLLAAWILIVIFLSSSNDHLSRRELREARQECQETTDVVTACRGCDTVDTDGRECFEYLGGTYVGDGPAPSALPWLALAASFAIFTVGLPGLTRDSLGKYIFMLRTVTEHGDRPATRQVAMRALGHVVDLPPVVALLPVGLLLMLGRRDHRRIGDIVARTFVVDRRMAGAPLVVPR